MYRKGGGASYVLCDCRVATASETHTSIGRHNVEQMPAAEQVGSGTELRFHLRRSQPGAPTGPELLTHDDE